MAAWYESYHLQWGVALELLQSHRFRIAHRVRLHQRAWVFAVLMAPATMATARVPAAMLPPQAAMPWTVVAQTTMPWTVMALGQLSWPLHAIAFWENGLLHVEMHRNRMRNIGGPH